MAGPTSMDHSSIVYLLDRNGRFVTHFTHEAKAEQIAAAVRVLLCRADVQSSH